MDQFYDDYPTEDHPFMSDILKNAGVPYLTSYKNLFGSKYFWILRRVPIVFCGLNQYNIIPFGFFQILLLLSIVIWKIKIYDYYFDHINWYFYLIAFVYINLAISLFRCVLTNPGYLPFSYPAQPDKKEFTIDDYKLGMAYSQEQVNWAIKQKRPNRAIFSRRVGYYVLRADHYCNWVTNWVALYNHRYFVIFISFSTLYCILLLINIVHMFIYHRDWHSIFLWIFFITHSFFFTFLFGLQVLNQFANISRNILTVEILKGRTNYYNRGCLNNWVEICGDTKYWFLWPWACFKLKPGSDGFDYPDYHGPNEESDDGSDNIRDRNFEVYQSNNLNLNNLIPSENDNRKDV